MSPSGYQYLFGPVRSRRLGLSLGVDLVPNKTCSLDCVYCQVGRTTALTVERRAYHPVDAILDELDRRLAELRQVDFITLSGSGEPTLHSRLGDLVDQIKQRWSVPVAIITNGTLLWRPDVRRACLGADLVMPSLDAADTETFRRINRPSPDLSLVRILSGLVDFRNEYSGQLWLEVFLIDGVNTGPESLRHLREQIGRIRPDRVQLNTAVRPTAQPGIAPLSPQRLEQVRRELGLASEIIEAARRRADSPQATDIRQAVLEMIRRRPCSPADIAASLGVASERVETTLADLMATGLVVAEDREGIAFYRPA